MATQIGIVCKTEGGWNTRS